MSTVLIDCDGVMADFTDYLLELVGSNLRMPDILNWDVFGFMTSGQKRTALMILSGAAFWESQPCIVGAQAFVAAVRDAGHRVICVTTPWAKCPAWDDLRRDWLKRHFQFKRRDIAPFDDKSILRGDLFIDDKPAHIAEWAEANPDGLAYLFDAPYNRPSSDPAFEWPTRVHWRSASCPGHLRVSDARALIEAL